MRPPAVDAILAAAPIVALTFNVLGHVSCVRLLPARPYLSLLVGFAVGGGASGIAGALLLRHLDVGIASVWAAGVMAAATYAALSYGYFAFANLTITSLRMRLLQDVNEHGGRVPFSTLRRSYAASHVLDARLERLLSAGQLTEAAGRYRVNRPALLRLAGAIEALRLVVFGRRRER